VITVVAVSSCSKTVLENRKMKKGFWIAILAPGALVVIVGVFVLSLLLIKVLWAWTVPDLFPGAVEQGLIARSISWMTALKLAIFTAVITVVARGVDHDKK
jgi:hypothetical protein